MGLLQKLFNLFSNEKTSTQQSSPSSGMIYSLGIYGSYSNSGNLNIAGSSGTNSTVNINPNGGNLYLNPQGSASGNVAIGTNSPDSGSILTVNGITSINGNTNITGNVSVCGSTSFNGDIELETNAAINGNTNINGRLNVSQNSVLGLNASAPTSLLVSNNPTGGCGVHWNLTGGSGESDFINFSPNTTPTAFNFYNVRINSQYTLPSQLPSPLLSINSNGGISVSTNIINSSTQCYVAQWGQSEPVPAKLNNDFRNGTIFSSGGYVLNNVDGYSITAGSGNYGYYCIDLGEQYSGYLFVDMVLCKSNSSVGLWNIITSQNEFNTPANFQNDSTAVQAWNNYQDISSGILFNSNVPNWYVMPIQTAIYISNARTIYIGAVDLGNGQLGLKINNVRLTPLLLS